LKLLIFIESEREFQAAERLIQEEGNSGKSLTVVNLNSGLRFSFPSRPGFNYRTEDDYLRDIPLHSLNFQAMEDCRRWFDHETVAHYLTFQGVPLAVVYEHSLVRAITTLYKFIELILKILKTESPDKIVVFQDLNISHGTELRFTGDDSLAGKILRLVNCRKVRGEEIPVRMLDLPSKAPLKKSGRRQARELVRFLLRYVRRGLNAFLPASSRTQGAILAVGASRIVFPLLEALKPLESYRLAYFQKMTAPRLLGWLWRNRILYETLEDYSANTRDSEAQPEAFSQAVRAQGLFCYRGIDLLPVLEEKLNLLFRTLVPAACRDIDVFQKLLLGSACRLIIIDEDISVSSRLLLLTAKSLGVPSIEFQHGVITKYFLELEIADRKAVWGNYFKEKIQEELGLAPEKILAVGPVHLEHLNQFREAARRHKSIQKVCQTLRIPEKARRVLYTPHGFHKSSKGGSLTRHATRSEAENMLQELGAALDGRGNTHLIIKLHHADHHPEFYRDLIDEHWPNLRYSILRQWPIHELLNACDVLVTPISTTILEAVLIERPVILLNLENKKIIFPYVEWKAVECAEEKGELRELIDRILDRPEEALHRVSAGRKTLKKEFVCGYDGLSGQRFQEAVKELLVTT
jgi:hypothetical protein